MAFLYFHSVPFCSVSVLIFCNFVINILEINLIIFPSLKNKHFQCNFRDYYEKFLSNSVDLMKNILWWEMCAAAAERS